MGFGWVRGEVRVWGEAGAVGLCWGCGVRPGCGRSAPGGGTAPAGPGAPTRAAPHCSARLGWFLGTSQTPSQPSG